LGKKLKKLLVYSPADGCLIINGAIDKLQEITGDLDCRVITFNKEAVNSDGSAADYYPSDITYDELGHPSFTLHCHGEESGSFSLQVPGEHNVCNAVASIALADLLSIDRGITVSALHDFTGTDRRFEYKGTIGGVTISMTTSIIPQRSQPLCMPQPTTLTRLSGASSSPIPTPGPRRL